MKKLIVTIAATLFAASAYAADMPGAMKEKMGKGAESAQGRMGECEARALSKDGKPLAGAARSASVKKCMQGGMDKPMPPMKSMPGTEPKPMPEMKPEAKPEPGAGSQQMKMKRCSAEAKGKVGDDFKMFMKTCLGGK